MSDFDNFISNLNAETENELAARRERDAQREADKQRMAEERRTRLLTEFLPIMEQAVESCKAAGLPAAISLSWDNRDHSHEKQWICFSMKSAPIKGRYGGMIPLESPNVFCEIDKSGVAQIDVSRSTSPACFSDIESQSIQEDLRNSLKEAITRYVKLKAEHEP